MKNIKILLLYPPEQSWPNTMVKPNGSLAYPYLGGALRNIDVEVIDIDGIRVQNEKGWFLIRASNTQNQIGRASCRERV